MQLAELPVRAVSTICRALGDETRLRIVALLSHSELCVCHIESALGLSQPTASRQLAILRAAGLVDSRRDGSWVHYHLVEPSDPLGRRLLADLVASFARHAAVERDLVRLTRSKGPGSCP